MNNSNEIDPEDLDIDGNITNSDKKLAEKQISNKMAELMKLLQECEYIAEKYKVIFRFDGPYGMGGSYIPKGENEYDSGWSPSSQGC